MSLCNWNQNVILFTVFVLQVNGELVTPPCLIHTIDGLLTASCGYNVSSKVEDTSQLPDDLPSDIQALVIAPENAGTQLTYNITSEQLLKFPKLLRLVFLSNAEMHTDGCEERFYATLFKDLDSLEHFEFVYSQLTDRCIVQLPKNLKTVVFNNNRYTRLDVHWCPKLEALMVDDNKLKSMPKLHNPLPPLKKLNMLGSTLDNMTIFDIAPLCNLTSLEVSWVPGVPADDTKINNTYRYCQCLIFTYWAEEFNISGLQLSCKKPADLVENVDCSETNTTIEAARKLREERCRIQQAETEVMPKNSINNVIKMAFFVFFVLLLISSLVYLFSRWDFGYSTAARDEDMVNEESEGEEEELLDEPTLTTRRTDSRYAGEEEPFDEPILTTRRTDSRYAGGEEESLNEPSKPSIIPGRTDSKYAG